MLHEAGLAEIRIRPKDASRQFIRRWIEGRHVATYVVSSTIERSNHVVRAVSRPAANEP